MRITILFGGTNKERLVSVASAQALHQALPEAGLWFWDVDDTVHETRSEALLGHSRPFEDAFRPGTPSLGKIEAALLAINAADDERNPPETGVTEAALKQVKNGKLLLIPASAETSGHLTTGNARFYAKELHALLASAPQRAM